MSRMSWLLANVLLLLPSSCADSNWDWDNTSQPISIYRSRPDLLAPILTPLEGIHDRDKLSPGLFFVSPYMNVNPGICIYDNDLSLVWTSFGSYGPGPSHAPRVCTYKGEAHLCFYAGTQHVGWGHGHGVIMDGSYRTVKTVNPSCFYAASSDMHEFYLNEDGTRALMTQYVRSVYDLCPNFGLCDGLAYIQSGVFQEIDVETGECIFSWNSLDHISPEESLVPPDSTEISGSGSLQYPWDYFHINSIAKSKYDGAYLISARHTSAIYKVDGQNGSVLWQLGGKNNQYEYDNYLGNVEFGFQHDAQWISDSDVESIISIFDNGSNGFTETAGWTTGKIIRLNHVEKVARLLEEPLAQQPHLSKSQGNFQLDLPQRIRHANGGINTTHPANRLLNFGNDAFIAEYSWEVDADSVSSGRWTPVLYATLGWANVMNYRAFKFDGFVGRPLNPPALWSYSYDGSNMVTYISWNGHTEISHFSFYGSTDRTTNEWTLFAKDIPKKGFETVHEHSSMYTYVYAEVYSSTDFLGKSAIMTTFIPNKFIREKYCDNLACQFMDTDNANRDQNKASMLQQYQDYVSKSEDTTKRPEQKGVHEAKTFHLILVLSIGLALLALYCLHSFVRSCRSSGLHWTRNMRSLLPMSPSTQTHVKYSNLEIDSGFDNDRERW